MTNHKSQPHYLDRPPKQVAEFKADYSNDNIEPGDKEPLYLPRPDGRYRFYYSTSQWCVEARLAGV